MASKLEGFTFGFADGTERRGVEKCDNVIWIGDKCCVALVYQGDRLGAPPYRLDYGDEKRPEHMAGYLLKHSQYFEEFDPLTMRCIALEWVTHGGKTSND